MGNSARINALDGLRGWAALTIVAYHIVWETFGSAISGVHNPVFAIFLNRGLAVAIFFVLSGEALSVAYFKTRNEKSVVGSALKRYGRLTIPVAASSLIIFFIIVLRLNQNVQAGEIVNRSDWLGSALSGVPASPLYFLKWVLFGVYGEQKSGLSINPFLWTMHYELIGSMLVFVVLLAYRYVANPWLIILTTASVLAMVDEGYSNYSCFLFGIWIASARQSGFLQKLAEIKNSQPTSAVVIGVVAVVGGLKRLNGGFVWEHAVCFAVPLMIAAAVNKQATSFLSSRVSVFLGKISFPIFLLQFPVIVSITSWAIVYAYADGAITNWDAVWIASLSLCASIVVSALFLPVETFTSRVGRWIARRQLRSDDVEPGSCEPAGTAVFGFFRKA